MIACYKQNIHLLPFADVFLKSLFVFAGGEIGHYGGEIAQLILKNYMKNIWTFRKVYGLCFVANSLQPIIDYFYGEP